MTTKVRLTDWLLKVKYLDYVKPSAANGTVRAIYVQADREFGLAADPIVVHSPLPALLGAFWEFGRETVLVCQRATRLEKESIIAAVSLSNTCPFCVDAHTIFAASLSDGGLALRSSAANSIASMTRACAHLSSGATQAASPSTTSSCGRLSAPSRRRS